MQWPTMAEIHAYSWDQLITITNLELEKQFGEGHAALVLQHPAATSSTADRACKQSNS